VTDLTGLNAANAALQASPTVAKATKDYGAAATAALHALAGDTPQPPSGHWAWDASAAPLDPSSAAVVTKLLATAGTFGYFAGAVATQTAPAGTPAYAVPTKEKVTPLMAPLPPGTRPGCTNDASLTVRDATGIDYDFGNAVYNTGRITGCFGATTQPAGAITEGTVPNSATAARFPLRAGLVTVADVASGVIAHPLVCSINNVGPAPNRYPSSALVGYPANSGPCLGSWFRLDPAVQVASLGLPKLDAMLAVALQKYGVFVRDVGSNFVINGEDRVNYGGNAVDWPAVGVTFEDKTPAGVPYAHRLSAAFPWAHLQLLLPPAP